MQSAKICLMVDDDIDDQEIFSIAVKDLDVPVQCVFALDGTRALKIFEEDPDFYPDIIFLDFNMPKMNGKECLTALKSIERLRNIPVIIISTSSEKKLEKEVKQGGAAAYFTKPSSIAELTKKLSEFINKI
jgi:CheY-like chemotaxis protein